MKWLRRHDAQALVDGTYSGSAHDASYDAVASFFDGLRNEAAALPAPAPRPRLAATLDGRRPLRSASDPIPVPARAPFPARLRALRPATIAIASGAVFFGGLATAGALPGPLQHVSANLTSHVGLHLPGGTVGPAPAPRHPAGNGSAPATTPANPAKERSAATRSGTTTTTRPGQETTPPHGSSPTTPTSGTGTLPVETPVTVPGTVTVTVPLPGDKPPIVVTLPSLPVELPPVTLPTLPHRRDHDK